MYENLNVEKKFLLFWGNRLLQLVLSIWLMLIVGSSGAQATTGQIQSSHNCSVGGVGASHVTIQSAINDVACEKVIVAPGTYYENLVIDRSLKIVGSGNRNANTSTIIDGDMLNRVLYVQSSSDPIIEVSLSYLTLTNGSTTQNGGGILNEDHSDLTLRYVTVDFNAAARGGGIYNTGRLSIIRSKIDNNLATQNAGGVESSMGGGGISGFSLLNSLVTNNLALDTGGGLYLSTYATIQGSQVLGNGAEGNAGGIYQSAGFLDVFDSVIDDNHSTRTAGIVTDREMTINNSSISYNEGGNNLLNGDVYGVGLSVLARGNVTVTNSTIVSNTHTASPSVQVYGGGIYVTGHIINGSGRIVVFHSNISYNHPNGVDASRGVHTGDSDLLIVDSIIEANTGDGISGPGSNSNITIENTRVIGNGGKGIYHDNPIIINSLISDNTGTGVYAWESAAISYSTIENNGGGGVCCNNGTIDTSNIRGNTSAGDGGGIHAMSAFTVTNSTVSGNSTAGNGGGIAVTSTAGDLTLTSSTVSGNQADLSGGGVYFESSASGQILASTISQNTADADANDTGSGGGIAHNAGDTVTVTSSIIADNFDDSPLIKGPDCYGSFQSNNNNLVGIENGCINSFVQWNDLVGNNASPIDPMLGALADNGGSTLTHALQAGSPAIDTGLNANCQPADQRGAPRPYPAGNGSFCDKGAFEITTCSAPTTPSLIAMSQLSGAFTMQWSADPNSIGYEIRRGTNPNNSGSFSTWKFNPANVTTVTDYGALPNTDLNYFYTIVGHNACGAESSPSSVNGEFSFALQPAFDSPPNFATFSVPLSGSDIPANTDDLALLIDPNGSIQRLASWNPATGSWFVDFINFGPNYPVSAGDFFVVPYSDAAPFSFGFIGQPPSSGSISNNLTPNAWNVIMIPLDQIGQFPMTSEGLADEIGGINMVAAWNRAEQKWNIWEYATPHPFNLKPGYPYAVFTTGTAPSNWP